MTIILDDSLPNDLSAAIIAYFDAGELIDLLEISTEDIVEVFEEDIIAKIEAVKEYMDYDTNDDLED